MKRKDNPASRLELCRENIEDWEDDTYSLDDRGEDQAFRANADRKFLYQYILKCRKYSVVP